VHAKLLHSAFGSAMLPTMFTKRVTLIAATYGMAFTLIGCSNRDKEPSANGRLLNEWVFQIATTDPGSSANRQAEDAIQQIGTNALPFLIKWISEAQPKMLAEGDVVADRMAMAAPAAFTALRGKGETAIPALTQVLTNGNPIASACAAHALGRIGKPGLPSLIVALNDSKPDVRKNGADFMIFMGTNARPAIPALEKVQNDPNPKVRAAVAIMLEFLTRKDATNNVKR
jgi:HEAT repeat protein